MAAHEFTITRRVEFSETDLAGIVHFSNFCRYMEHAEHAFFRSLDRSIVDRDLGVGWPRVHLSCDFKKPLRFEDEVEIQLLVYRPRPVNPSATNFVFAWPTRKPRAGRSLSCACAAMKPAK